MSSRNKSQKFVELANRRVNRALRDLKLISNLANRKNYEYTDEQAKKVVRALLKEVESVRRSFEDPVAGQSDAFRL
jgi:hypothetical protein